jgi:hypothetical protein
MVAESPECTGVISGRGRRRPRTARRGGEGGGGRGGAAPSPGEGSRGPASGAAHLDVHDAVVDRDERLSPEERERAGGRGGDLERAAHAGGPWCSRRRRGRRGRLRPRHPWCSKCRRGRRGRHRPRHAALRRRWEPPRRTNWRGTGRRGSSRPARGTATSAARGRWPWTVVAGSARGKQGLVERGGPTTITFPPF